MSWIVRPFGAAAATPVPATTSMARRDVRCIVAIYHSTVGFVVETTLQYLRTPLVVLSGTPVSLLTLLTAITIVIAARIVAAVVGRSLERVLVARGTMGVNTSAIMGAGAVLLVGIGFGLQKLAENFISGLLLLLERPVRKGDFIDVGGVLGTVEDIGLRATHVISRDGVTMIVPNANLVTSLVINHCVPTNARRISIKIGVAYDTDLDHAVNVLMKVADDEPMVMDQPPHEVRHTGFSDSSIDLALVAWIPEARDELIVASKHRFAITRAFRAENISIPFPQREVRVVSDSSLPS